jgi:uncharacterized protein (TIGR00369 family)
MKGKTVSETATVMSQLMGPQDVNLAGNVHGGVVMRLIDTVAGVVAVRHSRCNAVTASIDRLDFLYPVYVGDIVTFKASVNYVGTTSMEIGVRVETENLYSEKSSIRLQPTSRMLHWTKPAGLLRFHLSFWKLRMKNVAIEKPRQEEPQTPGKKAENHTV